jgi:hypothetical protein
VTAKKTTAKPPVAATQHNGREAFRVAHVKSVIIPKKIEAAIKAMRAKAADAWMYDMEFLREAGVSANDAKPFREQFADFTVIVGPNRTAKTVWCCSKALAEEFRALI